MISFASSKNKVKVDKVLTITKGLNFETGKQKLVIDIYVVMNQPTKGNHQYLYIDNYTNTIMIKIIRDRIRGERICHTQ